MQMTNRVNMDSLNHTIHKSSYYLALLARREWFAPILRDLRKSQYAHPEELRALQLERINTLVSHARRKTIHYQKLLPEKLNSLADIQDLPLLRKDYLRHNSQSLMTAYGNRQRLKSTGGSTSAPVTLLKDNHGAAHELAASWRCCEWAGIRIGERQARFWSMRWGMKDNVKARLTDFVCARRRFAAFAYDDQAIRHAMASLHRFRPDYLYGYVSVIKDFALEAIKADGAPGIRPKAIITTAEVLTETDRALIKEAFGAPVFNEYGCGEIGTIAQECEHGSMHINSENAVVEILDENGEIAAPGTPGELVVTDLTNFSMPLIRYRISDYGYLHDGELCSCGRTLPVVGAIHGRQWDTFTNTKGIKFHGSFFIHMIDDAKKKGIAVSGVQFIQHANLDIHVKLICEAHNFTALTRKIESTIHQEFDSNIAVTAEPVTVIEREPSGKLRTVKRCATESSEAA